MSLALAVRSVQAKAVDTQQPRKHRDCDAAWSPQAAKTEEPDSWQGTGMITAFSGWMFI